MLEIKANKNVFLDGEKVNLSPGEYEDFFIRCYKIELVLDKTLTLGDFLDVMYPIKNDVKKRYLEEYGQECPKYPHDDFSISLALIASIC